MKRHIGGGGNLDLESYNTIIKARTNTDKAFICSSTDIKVAKEF